MFIDDNHNKDNDGNDMISYGNDYDDTSKHKYNGNDGMGNSNKDKKT